MRNRSHIAGFTLIELLVCLMVTGCAVLLVSAQFRPPRQEKVALAARQVMSDLVLAQSGAIAHGTMEIARFDAPVGSLMASANFDGQAAIAFDDLGMPYSYCPQTRKTAPLSAGSVVVKDGADVMVVRILPITGQIEVQ